MFNKGAVCVFSSEPLSKDGNSDSNLYSSNLNLIKNVEDNVVFLTLNVFNADHFSVFLTRNKCAEKAQIKMNSFQKQKNGVLINNRSKHLMIPL